MSTQKKNITENNKMNLEEISSYFKFHGENMNRLNLDIHEIKQKIKSTIISYHNNDSNVILKVLRMKLSPLRTR